MRANYDKYEPYANGFRALINADFTDQAKFGTPLGVSLNANGRVVIGSGGNTGIQGVLILGKKKRAGAVVDVMTSGEITGVEGYVAGTKYYAQANGDITTSATSATAVGFTAESDRLVVRMAV